MAGAEPDARRRYRAELLDLLARPVVGEGADAREGWDEDEIRRHQEQRDAMIEAGFGMATPDG